MPLPGGRTTTVPRHPWPPPAGSRNSDLGTLTPSRPKAGGGGCDGELRAPEKAAGSTLCLREGRVPPGPRTAAGAGACDWEPACALPTSSPASRD